MKDLELSLTMGSFAALLGYVGKAGLFVFLVSVGGWMIGESGRRVLFLITVCLLAATLLGCGGTFGVKAELQIADELRKPCVSKDTMPRLTATEDTAILKFQEETLATVAKCANEKQAVIDLVDEYNKKVVRKGKDK